MTKKMFIERAIGYAFRLMTIKMSHSSGRVKSCLTACFCSLHNIRDIISCTNPCHAVVSLSEDNNCMVSIHRTLKDT
jgi:hypothetical protein